MGANNSKEKASKKKQKNKKRVSAPAGYAGQHTTQSVSQTQSGNHTMTVQRAEYYAVTRTHESTATTVKDAQSIQQQFNFPSTSTFPNQTISASSNIQRKFSVPALIDRSPNTISKITTPALRPAIPPMFRATAPRGPLARSFSGTAQTDAPISNRPPGRLRLPTVPIVQGQDKQNSEDAILDIQIKKCITIFDPNDSHIPSYDTRRKKRGMSLIINNVKFPKPRSGGEYDGTNIFNLLNGLKLQPKILKNLKAKEMTSAVEKFARNSDLANVDVCVVVIMSHGSGTMDTATEISGIDENTVKVTDIISYFSREKCKHLRDKPKVFIFQCCRGDHEPAAIETDAIGTRPAHCDDMLLCYSTMPGFVSYRNVELGSYYIREICSVFSKHAWDTHVEDMLKKVQDNVKKRGTRQCTTFENLSFKTCYLNPI